MEWNISTVNTNHGTGTQAAQSLEHPVAQVCLIRGRRDILRGMLVPQWTLSWLTLLNARDRHETQAKSRELRLGGIR